MQATEFDSYIVSLDELFSKIVRTFNKIQLEDYSTETLKKSKDLIKKGSEVLSSLKLHTKSIETLLSDCSDFTNEILDDMTCEPKQDYVFQTKNGMLGYPGKEFIVKLLNQPNPAVETKTITPTPTVHIKEDKVLINEIGYYLRTATVQDLSCIPPAIYYYKSADESKYPSGLYMRMPNNNLIRIPFPEVVDSKKEYDRKHSIRCKYHSKAECDAQRQKMAKIYNSTVRICNFAHSGDRMVKIGYPSRCPSIPNFGNPQTMSTDIKNILEDDAKNMLMYGCSDILTAAIWFDYSAVGNKEYLKLDVC